MLKLLRMKLPLGKTNRRLWPAISSLEFKGNSDKTAPRFDFVHGWKPANQLMIWSVVHPIKISKFQVIVWDLSYQQQSFISFLVPWRSKMSAGPEPSCAGKTNCWFRKKSLGQLGELIPELNGGPEHRNCVEVCLLPLLPSISKETVIFSSECKKAGPRFPNKFRVAVIE